MSTYLGSRNPKYVSTSGGCTSSFRHRGLRVVAVFGTSHDLVQATGNVWRSEMLVTCFALVFLRDTHCKRGYVPAHRRPLQTFSVVARRDRLEVRSAVQGLVRFWHSAALQQCILCAAFQLPSSDPCAGPKKRRRQVSSEEGLRVRIWQPNSVRLHPT